MCTWQKIKVIHDEIWWVSLYCPKLLLRKLLHVLQEILYKYMYVLCILLTPCFIFNPTLLVFFLNNISFCLPGCLQTVLLCQAPKYEIIGMYHYALYSSLLCLIITCWLGIVKWPAHFFLVKLLNHTYKVCQLVLFVIM